MDTLDERLMARAVAVGERGRRTSPPNPWVGCVLVRDGEVVGEGFHRAAGEPHAEVHALREAGDRARGATLYVTLEPCAHTGRTPPCTEAVIEAGVTRVVVAIEDPDERVRGKGIEVLRTAGLEVDLGVAVAQARAALRPYLYQRRTGLAYVVLKAATTIDGRTAAADGTSKWISGEASRADAHELRADSQAIVVGSETARLDKPSLTVRGVTRPPDQPPLRVVLDARGRTPASGPLFDRSLGPTLMVTTRSCDEKVLDRWQARGAQVVAVPASPTGKGLNLATLFAFLGQQGILQLLVEGGSAVLGACVESRLAQRLVVYQAPLSLAQNGYPLFGGLGPTTIKKAHQWRLEDVRRLDGDVRLEYTPEWAWEVVD